MEETQISVQGGKYVVVRVKGQSLYPARNWKQLAAEAEQAVRSHTGGTVLHVGLYPCPETLARQAK